MGIAGPRLVNRRRTTACQNDGRRLRRADEASGIWRRDERHEDGMVYRRCANTRRPWRRRRSAGEAARVLSARRHDRSPHWRRGHGLWHWLRPGPSGDWNGRFLFQGGGGLNGCVRSPSAPRRRVRTPAWPAGSPSSGPTPDIRAGGFDGTFSGTSRRASTSPTRPSGELRTSPSGSSPALRPAAGEVVFRGLLHRRT